MISCACNVPCAVPGAVHVFSPLILSYEKLVPREVMHLEMMELELAFLPTGSPVFVQEEVIQAPQKWDYSCLPSIMQKAKRVLDAGGFWERTAVTFSSFAAAVCISSILRTFVDGFPEWTSVSPPVLFACIECQSLGIHILTLGRVSHLLISIPQMRSTGHQPAKLLWALNGLTWGRAKPLKSGSLPPATQFWGSWNHRAGHLMPPGLNFLACEEL